MDIERIKRWQWALIGLCVGLALAASRSFYAPEYFGKSLDENFNVYAPGTAAQPVATLLAPGAWFLPRHWFYLSDLVVHVPTQQANESSPAYWVTGLLHEVKPAIDPKTGGLIKAGDGWKFDNVSTQDFFHRGLVPYRVGKSTYPTIRMYLDSLAEKDGKPRYRYAWWERPVVIWTLYPLAGFIVIGGVWPMVVSLLVGAGLGLRRAGVLPASASPATESETKISPPAIDVQANGRDFGTQQDQFYPTEIHHESPE